MSSDFFQKKKRRTFDVISHLKFPNFTVMNGSYYSLLFFNLIQYSFEPIKLVCFLIKISLTGFMTIKWQVVSNEWFIAQFLKSIFLDAKHENKLSGKIQFFSQIHPKVSKTVGRNFYSSTYFAPWNTLLINTVCSLDHSSPWNTLLLRTLCFLEHSTPWNTLLYETFCSFVKCSPKHTLLSGTQKAKCSMKQSVP